LRFHNIQLLRVAAAIGVVLYHLECHAPQRIGVDFSWLRYGLIGGFPVPLFFAVSGFVLAQAVRTASPGRFLLARFLRLYPGYWLALVGVVVLMRLRVFTEYHRWLIYFINLTELTLWPAGPAGCTYLLGVEWSLVYEAFLSVALAGLSLFGARRGVPILSAMWLAAIGVKMVLWPGYHFDPIPNWPTIALSVYNVPFLLGVLTYQLKDLGGKWRWAVLLAVVALLYVISTRPVQPELGWSCMGLAAAGAVWLAVTFSQVKESNPLARLGDCTYGLFLFHGPLLLAVLYPASRLGWVGRVEVLWVAVVAAIGGGLVFGRLESALHSQLRPLAKVKPAEFKEWLVRIRTRLHVRPTLLRGLWRIGRGLLTFSTGPLIRVIRHFREPTHAPTDSPLPGHRSDRPRRQPHL
jgi:peptidoglycan/LPS O-acetylase OafA/YrhL